MVPNFFWYPIPIQVLTGKKEALGTTSKGFFRATGVR